MDRRHPDRFRDGGRQEDNGKTRVGCRNGLLLGQTLASLHDRRHVWQYHAARFVIPASLFQFFSIQSPATAAYLQPPCLVMLHRHSGAAMQCDVM
jgi:hypothetical protein